jgi:transcriptional regulator with XRE-family HTH domain
MANLGDKLGSTIRRLRAERGLTQDSFAAVVGVHRTYIGAVERGETNVTLDTLERLATALKISPSELLAAAEAQLKTSKGRFRA